MEAVWYAVVAAASAAIPVTISWIRGRNQDEAETAHTLIDSAVDVVELLRKQQEENTEHIVKLEATVEKLQNLADYQEEEIRELRAKLSRWEERFSQLGVTPPNGSDHTDTPDVAVAPV